VPKIGPKSIQNESVIPAESKVNQMFGSSDGAGGTLFDTRILHAEGKQNGYHADTRIGVKLQNGALELNY
jgi:hypothetical protein